MKIENKIFKSKLMCLVATFLLTSVMIGAGIIDANINHDKKIKQKTEKGCIIHIIIEGILEIFSPNKVGPDCLEDGTCLPCPSFYDENDVWRNPCEGIEG
jgi:hypothetical protein